MAFCSIGVYSVNANVYESLCRRLLRATAGYVLMKLKCEPAPLLLGFVIGPLLEENLRRAMTLGRGDPTVFLTRPISLTLILLTVAVLLVVLLPQVRRKRAEVFRRRGLDRTAPSRSAPVGHFK